MRWLRQGKKTFVPETVDVSLVTYQSTSRDVVLMSFTTEGRETVYALDPHVFLKMVDNLKSMDEEMRRMGYAR